jgi:hypothetical protein
MYDTIESPLRRNPPSLRRLYAVNMIYNNKTYNPEKENDLSEYIELIQSVTFNTHQAVIDSCKEKIIKLNELIEDQNLVDPKRITLINDSINALNIIIERNESDLIESDEKIQLKGGGKLSLIEKLKRNQELWAIKNKAKNELSTNHQNSEF